MTAQEMDEIALKTANVLIEKSKAERSATPVPAPAEVTATPSIRVGKDAAAGTGIRLARYIKALGVAKMTGRSAVDVAKNWGYHDVAKALQQDLFSAGGSLVHEEYASELVPLLRNQSVVRRAGARTMPMGAGIRFDRQASAATAYYGAENTAITPSEPSTEQFQLSEKKLTGLVPMSNDWIRNASISTEEFVRDDLVRVLGLKEDLAFLRGDGTQGSPLGIRFRLASANCYTETCASEAAPTLAEVKKELAKARKTLKKANVPMVKPVWLVSPNFEAGLDSVPGPGGDGSNEIAYEYNTKGTVRGYPVFVSNQIPINVLDTGTGATGATASYDRSEIYLVDMNEVVIGESMGLEVEVFPNGTYSNSGTLVSGISNDLTVIRAIQKHDINLFHTTGGVCITNSSWGQ
jgi:HK97 family phage major capsid protein